MPLPCRLSGAARAARRGAHDGDPTAPTLSRVSNEQDDHGERGALLPDAPPPIPDLVEDTTKALNEVHGLHTLRFVWKNLVAMLQSDPPGVQHYTLVNSYLSTIYVHTLAIGIRRQTDAAGPRRATIVNLLVRLHGRAVRGELSADQPQVNLLTIDQQIAELSAAERAARRYVNQAIAHLDSRRTASMTFGDLEQALAGLATASKYVWRAVHGSHLAWLTPWHDHDWAAMFAAPWFVPGRTTLVDSRDLG